MTSTASKMAAKRRVKSSEEINPEQEVELSYLQTLIDSAQKEAKIADRELKSVLQQHSNEIETIRSHVSKAHKEHNSLNEYFDTARIPDKDLDSAKIDLKNEQHRYEQLNDAVTVIEPMVETQRQLQELDNVIDVREAVELIGEVRVQLEKMSPPKGQPVPDALLELRQNYAQQRKHWREVVEARFHNQLRDIGDKSVQADGLAWKCAELLGITPNIIDLFVKHLVPKLRPGNDPDPWIASLLGDDTATSSMSHVAKIVFEYVQTVIPSVVYGPLVRKLWPAIVRLARTEDLSGLLLWEKELLKDESLNEPEPNLNKRYIDMITKRDAALRKEVLESVRYSLIVDIESIQENNYWISRGVSEVIQIIEKIEKIIDGKLLQDIIGLFSILRPEKGNIGHDPKAAILLFNDCQYMIKKCANIAAPKMPMLRRLGEKHMRQFLNYCLGEYRKHLHHDIFFEISQHYNQSEAQVGQVTLLMQQHCKVINTWATPPQAQVLVQWIAKELVNLIFNILEGMQTRPRPSFSEIPLLVQLLTPLTTLIDSCSGPNLLTNFITLMNSKWQIIEQERWIYQHGTDYIPWSDNQIHILLFLNPNIQRPHIALSEIQMARG